MYNIFGVDFILLDKFPTYKETLFSDGNKPINYVRDTVVTHIINHTTKTYNHFMKQHMLVIITWIQTLATL